MEDPNREAMARPAGPLPNTKTSQTSSYDDDDEDAPLADADSHDTDDERNEIVLDFVFTNCLMFDGTRWLLFRVTQVRTL